METKQVALIEVKADGDGPGSFRALASVFGNEDSQGDRVMPGAFKATIATMRKAGRVLPIVSSHNHSDPRFTIGTAKAADLTETDRGLEIKGQLDLENPIAAQVHRLFKSGAWTGWSFGYGVDEEAVAEDGVNELKRLSLVEAGPCLKGANPEAQLLEAKSALAEVKDMASMGKRMASMAAQMVATPPPDPAAMAKRVRSLADEMAAMGTASDPPSAKEEPEETSTPEEDVDKEAENAKPRDPLKDQLVAGHLDDRRR